MLLSILKSIFRKVTIMLFALLKKYRKLFVMACQEAVK